MSLAIVTMISHSGNPDEHPDEQGPDECFMTADSGSLRTAGASGRPEMGFWRNRGRERSYSIERMMSHSCQNALIRGGRRIEPGWRAGESDLDFRSWIHGGFCKLSGACAGFHRGQDTGAVVQLRLRRVPPFAERPWQGSRRADAGRL